MPEPRTDQVPNAAARRLRGFRLHLVGYFVVVGACVVVNRLFTPGFAWFVWPMVGWGPVLALHVAYVMGLFGKAGPR
ncbi:MAG TPA: 2TM domain-containing protein [Alphaproteobacteria bacterium]|nr:2TM domain-containing protein [Alphaproteobacteria bacterium]